MSNLPAAVTIEEHFFADDGRVPNNPSLPLIVYRGAVETGARAAAACEALFAENGWSGGGATASTLTTTTTAPPMRFSASLPAPSGSASAARAERPLNCTQAMLS